MLDVLLALAMIYFVFGATVASIFTMFERDCRGCFARWLGITVAWLPRAIYWVSRLAVNTSGMQFGLRR